MWTQTRVTNLLGIDLPIFQGPFGGGYSTPALAAAVSNAGGLGAYGAVSLAPDELKAVVADIAARTSRPFAINLWVPIPGQDDAPLSDEEFARASARLRPFREELGLPEPARPATFSQRFEAQVEALLEARPPIFSFIMGIPDRAILDEARRRGVKTIGAATTVEEAVALADAGTDVIVASGSDAGGHRASFLRPVDDSLVGTMSLVPQVARAVPDRPVVAAGGIADGRGIAAALALGADGVQIGTAFLASTESGAPAAHKALLGRPESRQTRLTRVFSGRLARGIPNALMRALERDAAEIPPYPVQNWLTTPIRRAAAQAGRADLLALWAGENAASARPLAAAELMRLLVDETDAVLADPRLRPARSIGPTPDAYDGG
jgi:nitronate monooxygenase